MIRSQCLYSRKHILAALDGRKSAIPKIVILLGVLVILELLAVKAMFMFFGAIVKMFHSSPVISVILSAYVIFGVGTVTLILVRACIMYYSLLFAGPELSVGCEFGSDRFVVVLLSDKEKTTMTYGYEAVKYAVERKGFFVIATNEKNIAVAYGDMEEGTPGELRTLLSEKLGGRFTAKG